MRITIRVEDRGRYWDHDVERTEPAPKSRFTGSKITRNEAIAEALSDAKFLLKGGVFDVVRED